MADMKKPENLWFGEETEPEDLGTIEMPDICTDDPWAITDDMGADYAMRKIREIRKDAETWIDFYQAQIDKIKDKTAFDEARYSGRLRQYLERQIQDGRVKPTRTRARMSLPNGTLTLKHKGPAYKVVDDAAMVEWLEKAGKTELVQVSKKAKWGELKPSTTLLQTDEGWQVCLAETGEVVPGIEAKSQPDEFVVEPELINRGGIK